MNLTNPPPQPDTTYGKWQGGWVDFDGTRLQVGAARADPGPFVNGDGPELANGDSLSFGDFRCRADQAGLFCVNYAHQSAARFSPAGIQPFGCLRSVPPPDGVGIAYQLLTASGARRNALTGTRKPLCGDAFAACIDGLSTPS